MAIDPSTLPGPLTLWKLDEGSGRVAKNHFASTPNSGDNLCYYPEQTIGGWTSGGSLAVAEYAAANPVNSKTTATRLSRAAGNGIMQLSIEFPTTGTYTFSCYVKSNDGGTHGLRLNLSGNSSSPSVTNAEGWKRITITGSVTAGSRNIQFGNDGSSAIDVLVYGFKVEAGGSVTAYLPAQGDLIFSLAPYDPAWIPEGLRMSASNGLLAFLDQQKTFTQVSYYAVFKSTSLSTYQFLLSERSAFTKFSLATSHPDVGGGFGVLKDNSLVAGTSSRLNDGAFHVLAATWDGITIRSYLDGVLIGEVAGSVTWTSTGLYLGHGSYTPIGDCLAAAVYTQGHSTAQVLQMTDYLQSLAAGKGVTITEMATIVLNEGDSISAAAFAPYVRTACESLSPKLQWYNLATAGAGMTQVASRSALADRFVTYTTPIYSLLIGANELSSISGATYWDTVKAHLLARKQAGHIVIAMTVLDRETPGFATNRNAFNTLLRTGLGTYYDVLCDLAADPTIGPDGAMNVANGLTSDGLHPTASTSNTYIAPLYAAALTQARALVPVAVNVNFTRSVLSPFNLSPFIL